MELLRGGKLLELQHLNLNANPISREAAAAAKAQLSDVRPDVYLQLPEPQLEPAADGGCFGLIPGWLSLAQSMYSGSNLLEWARITRSRGDVVEE